MADYQHPSGYVINNADYGSIFIGEDKGTQRTRQIELHSASNAALKLFSDGGFQIQSQKSGTSGSNKEDSIVSRSDDGLFINADSNIHISAGPTGAITLAAREIRFESTAHDETFVIRATKNLQLQADNIKIDGGTVAIGAKVKMLLRSPGPIYINSSAGVSIVEPKLSLCPKNLLQVVQTLSSNVFGY
jgi:uncharacterized protein (DUF2345 family)